MFLKYFTNLIKLKNILQSHKIFFMGRSKYFHAARILYVHKILMIWSKTEETFGSQGKITLPYHHRFQETC